MKKTRQGERPPRENLVRMVAPGLEFRAAAEGDSNLGLLTGHFAVFNQWTRIDSIFEGTFMERMAPGAFTKTFAESRESMRCLFQHGRDFGIGDKPLGPIQTLREDDQGAYYEVPLLDTSYNRDLLPGLKSSLYGASFRFTVVRDDVIARPARSAYNPDAIPERTVLEAKVREFGPVTFPAYEGATAGVRSGTDDFMVSQLLQDRGRVRQLLRAVALDPEDVASLAQLDLCIDQADELVDALLAKYGVDDPDEQGEAENEPAASAGTMPMMPADEEYSARIGGLMRKLALIPHTNAPSTSRAAVSPHPGHERRAGDRMNDKEWRQWTRT